MIFVVYYNNPYIFLNTKLYMKFIDKRDEIESELRKMPSFSKVSFLDGILKSDATIDVKRFVYLKLAQVYGDIGMNKEASRNIHKAAEKAMNLNDKAEILKAEIEFLIKSEDYEGVSDVFRRIVNLGGDSGATKVMIKEMFNAKARQMMDKGNKNKAVDAYEKMLGYVSEAEDEIMIKEILLTLYRDTGKIQDYNLLKAQFEKD